MNGYNDDFKNIDGLKPTGIALESDGKESKFNGEFDVASSKPWGMSKEQYERLDARADRLLDKYGERSNQPDLVIKVIK